MDESKQLILQILQIIDYKGEKQKFAQDFLDAIFKKAISSCVGSLTDDERDELEDKLSGVARSPKEVSRALFEYISVDLFDEAVEKSSKQIMKGYLETILPTITKEQREQIKKLTNPS